MKRVEIPKKLLIVDGPESMILKTTKSGYTTQNIQLEDRELHYIVDNIAIEILKEDNTLFAIDIYDEKELARVKVEKIIECKFIYDRDNKVAYSVIGDELITYNIRKNRFTVEKLDFYSAGKYDILLSSNGNVLFILSNILRYLSFINIETKEEYSLQVEMSNANILPINDDYFIIAYVNDGLKMTLIDRNSGKQLDTIGISRSTSYYFSGRLGLLFIHDKISILYKISIENNKIKYRGIARTNKLYFSYNTIGIINDHMILAGTHVWNTKSDDITYMEPNITSFISIDDNNFLIENKYHGYRYIKLMDNDFYTQLTNLHIKQSFEMSTDPKDINTMNQFIRGKVSMVNTNIKKLISKFLL